AFQYPKHRSTRVLRQECYTLEALFFSNFISFHFFPQFFLFFFKCTERGQAQHRDSVCVCVCVCVYEKEREREREGQGEGEREREGERKSVCLNMLMRVFM